MLILAFDVSSAEGSVAVLDGRELLARESLNPAQRSAQSLAPAIRQVLERAGKEPRDVKLIATTIGPGSFTGLRVGVTMAKTLAYALRCDLIGLNTLDILAAQIPSELVTSPNVQIHAVLDAQRKELFVGRYQAAAGDEESPRRLAEETLILPGETWLQTLRGGDIVTGSGLARWKEKLPASVVTIPAEFHPPDAVTIGRLALQEYEQGRRDDLWTFSPIYIRPSYADEKK